MIKLFRSLKKLTHLKGHIYQDELYLILTNFSFKKLNVYGERKSDEHLSDELHTLLVELIQNESLKIKELPWSCGQCENNPCPLRK